MGTAAFIPSATGFTEDALNQLVLAKVTSGKALRYYAGAAWRRAGHITSNDGWKAYVAAAAAAARNPVRVEAVPVP